MCRTEPVAVVEALERGLRCASVKESVSTSTINASGFTIRTFRVQHACLRVVIQLPLVAPEAHPPHTDPTINLGRQVWGLIEGTPHVNRKEKVVSRYCCSVASKATGSCVAGARGIGTRMVSALLSKMVRPNAPNTSRKTIIMRPRHDERVVSIQHPPKYHAADISGQTLPLLKMRQGVRVCPRPR